MNKAVVIGTIIIIVLMIGIPTFLNVKNDHEEKLIKVTENRIFDAARKCYLEEKCITNYVTLQDLYDNTESSKEKMLTLTTNAAPTNYTRASGNKFYMNGPTPNYIIMVIPTTWPVPVIGNPAGGTIGLGLEKTNISISGISGVKFNVYSTPGGDATIKEVYIN